jgi:hypothetical protein
MNGRVYDYNLGRFLSVDPFIQDPGNSQSMNPYSYIMNNPLSGIDPSGYRSICISKTSCRKVQGNQDAARDNALFGKMDKALINGASRGQSAGKSLTISIGSDISSIGSAGAVAKGANGDGSNDNAVTSSDITSGAGAVAGIAQHADTHPIWVGKNGQVKVNSADYYGNGANGPKAGQVALAKEIAKKLGIPIAAAFVMARGFETPNTIERIRQAGGSERDVTFEKIDAGVDITMVGVAFISKEAFALSLLYSGLDYASGGNLSKSIDNSAHEIARTPTIINKQISTVNTKIRNNIIDSFIRSFIPDDPRVAR